MTLTADLVRLAEVREVTYGVTPATPAWKVIRTTGESLAFTPTTTTSAEMNPTRAVPDSILTGGAVAGGISYELAKEAWFEEMLAGAMCNEWNADELVIGTLPISFTIEKMLPIDPTSTDYHRIPGCLVNGFALTIQPNAPITGGFELLGKEYLAVHDIVAGATYVDPVFNPVFTAPLVTDIGLAGIAATTQCFSNIVLTLNNNDRARECIGHLGAREMALGRCEVTLAFSLYYADADMLDALTEQEELDITFTVNDSDTPSNFYTFRLPRCKLTQCQVVAGGTGQDVVADCVATALLDPLTSTPLIITRGTQP